MCNNTQSPSKGKVPRQRTGRRFPSPTVLLTYAPSTPLPCNTLGLLLLLQAFVTLGPLLLLQLRAECLGVGGMGLGRGHW